MEEKKQERKKKKKKKHMGGKKKTKLNYTLPTEYEKAYKTTSYYNFFIID